MKTLFTNLAVVGLLLLIVDIACKKSNPEPVVITPPNPDKDLNRIIVSNDQIILWPKTECAFYAELYLNGEGIYQTNTNDLPKISGRMISGPTTAKVQQDSGFNLVSALFKISGLHIGVYEFEVSFDKKYGIKYCKDTCRIIVDSLSVPANEYVFSKQSWYVIGGWFQYSSQIAISNIYNYIPVDNAFKTFIKRESNSNWYELKRGDSIYQYYFNYKKSFPYSNGQIVIETDSAQTDKPDIKLIY